MTADDIKALAKETHYERTHGFTLCFVLDAQGKWHMGTADHEDEAMARETAYLEAITKVLRQVDGQEAMHAGPTPVYLSKFIKATSDEFNALTGNEEPPNIEGYIVVNHTKRFPEFWNVKKADPLLKKSQAVIRQLAAAKNRH